MLWSSTPYHDSYSVKEIFGRIKVRNNAMKSKNKAFENSIIANCNWRLSCNY